MTTQTVVVGSIFLAMAGAMALGFWLAYRSHLPKWVKLPCGAGALPNAPAALNANLLKAAECILAATGAPCEPFLAKVKVLVMPTQTWVDSYGRTVGGETYGYSIQSNVSMDVLCHELCHAWEMFYLGAPDVSHATWPKKGQAAADRAYRAWLAGPVA